MTALPVGPITLCSRDLPRVEFLGFLDVAIGANDLSVWLEEEEHPRDVGAADPQLEQSKRTMDGCGEGSTVIVSLLELEQTRGDELVQHPLLLTKRVEKLGHRLLALLRGVEDDAILHAPAPYNKFVVEQESTLLPG